MAYYRVDKRLFAVGDRITTAQVYYDKFVELAKVVEDALETHRPDSKTKRTSCLFVFEDLVAAKKHWSKMKEGKLYRVTIEDGSVLHRGDMALMDEMKELAEADKDMAPLAQAYWRGELSSRAEIELMLSSAVIAEVLSVSDSERQNYLKDRWGIARGHN